MQNKKVEEVIACVLDYGSFTGLAEKFAETMKKVYYYSPVEKEFRDIKDAAIGEGLSKVIKLENIFDLDIFKTIDLFVFPDIGYGGLQEHLRSLGKSVWGSMGADELELNRDLFIQVLKEVGLPVIKSKTINGLSALAKYLKQVENKWVKINSYRENMETWYHLNYDQSSRRLESLAVIFGGAKEQVIFVVQDTIESDMELGYDGWSVDGKFPSKSFQGYELKNELYLGSLLKNSELPGEINYINEKMSPVLKGYGYRNWWATEIRVSEGTPYFIDPTCRHPGQTGEHQWETCTNLADVIWQGANGIVVDPIFSHKFSAEATLHYTALSDNKAVPSEWRVLEVPKKIKKWVKLYHYCIIDDIFHFPPSKSDELGVVLGVGNTVEEAINHLQSNLDAMKHLPIHANISGFNELLNSILEAEKHGIKFASKIPKPGSIV